jgi:hypothetical protein
VHHLHEDACRPSERKEARSYHALPARARLRRGWLRQCVWHSCLFSLSTKKEGGSMSTFQDRLAASTCEDFRRRWLAEDARADRIRLLRGCRNGLLISALLAVAAGVVWG